MSILRDNARFPFDAQTGLLKFAEVLPRLKLTRPNYLSHIARILRVYKAHFNSAGLYTAGDFAANPDVVENLLRKHMDSTTAQAEFMELLTELSQIFNSTGKSGAVAFRQTHHTGIGS